MKRELTITFAIFCAMTSWSGAADPSEISYDRHVAPIFRQYCVGCHNTDDAEGGLDLENFAAMSRGGEKGSVIVASQPDQSRLILMLEKKMEPFMPPDDNEGPTAEEIAVLRAWIEGGAMGPNRETPPMPVLQTPDIATTGSVRDPIASLKHSPKNAWLAVARYGRVEILNADDRQLVHSLKFHAGQVNDLEFSADGKWLLAAGGEPGLYGEVRIWNTEDWQEDRTIRGHTDSLYAVCLNEQKTVLATGGYDQKIKLWDPTSGEELNTLAGHNDAVFDLAFHPEGRILGSASGDKTIKLWDVKTGKRLETLIEPTMEQYAVCFHPGGKTVAAGGADSRLRVWSINEGGRAGTNPILYARFAHEEPIIALAYSQNGRVLASSSEDRELRIWDSGSMELIRTLKQQPDWPTALSFDPRGQALVVGRIDGSLGSIAVDTRERYARSADRPLNELPMPLPHADADYSEKPPEVAESEPNNNPSDAMPISTPGVVAGTLDANGKRNGDTDLFRFAAKKGQAWIIETRAEKIKSPADTMVEVLHPDGEPVLRLQLRAIRDTYTMFRPIGSTQRILRVGHPDEMKLNQFVYLAGEVGKWYRMPQGPDSGMLFYAIDGKRKCYFETSPLVHALGDPVYIVEPHRPGAKFTDNGLPVFPLYYVNDDDATRKLGRDSLLTFTAPEDGEYLIRVTDTRGFSGPDFKYWLRVREPRPGFNVVLKGRARLNEVVGGRDPIVSPGGGKRIPLQLERTDGFNGEVTIDVENLPPGFHIPTPIVIQAGHHDADTVLTASMDAVQPTIEQSANVKLKATATILGKEVTRTIGNLGEIKLAESTTVRIRLEPDGGYRTSPDFDGPEGIVITPGTSITAMLRIERHNDFTGELKFDVENLPHGIIVDNIGLSGVLIRENEDERQIVLSAEDWVPETTRWIHATAQSEAKKGEGKQSSLPIQIHVRRPPALARGEVGK